jgi:DNA-binding winged helix-turn-helix (wHTH) protein
MTPLNPAVDSVEAETCYRFGSFELRPDGTLFRDDTIIALAPKELAALRFLLARPQQIVTVMELRRAVWGGVHVSTESVPRCVSSLRARLGSEDCIATIYKLGYRFDLPVEAVRSTAHQWQVAPGKDTERVEKSEEAEMRGLPRLAILPFDVKAGVSSDTGCALAEETMIVLSRWNTGAMEVVAREPVFSLAARGDRQEELAATVGADYLLCGTVSLLPMYWRIRAEMIRVSDSVQLWIEDFSVSRESVPNLDESSAAIMATLVAARVGARILVSLGDVAADRDSETHQSLPVEPLDPVPAAIHAAAADDWVWSKPSRLRDEIASVA